MGTTSLSRIAHQDDSLRFAEAHCQPWTPDEVEFVIEFTDSTIDADIAVALGRTLYAVENLQHRLRTNGVDFERARVRQAFEPLPQAPTCGSCFVQLPATGVCDTCA